MDFAQLSTITDADVLRDLLAEKLVEIATRDAVIAQRDKHLVDSEALLASRDAQIAAHEDQIARHTKLACWAHARRKFVDLEKASGSEIAREAIRRIARLYRIEEEARELDPDARHAYRQQHAAPHLADLHDWLREMHPKVIGSSGTAKAIGYSLKRWPALARYLEDGRHPIDNNPIENAIRPIALGRKNWLFAGSEPAGKRAAAIMSLIATAKACGHDPHAWMSDVLERLPTTLDRDIATLLPQSWAPAG